MGTSLSFSRGETILTELPESYRNQQMKQLANLRKRCESKEKELANIKRMISEMEQLLEQDLVAPAPAVHPEAIEGIVDALNFISKTHTDPEIKGKATAYSQQLQAELKK